jgi:hypothetical protein
VCICLQQGFETINYLGSIHGFAIWTGSLLLVLVRHGSRGFLLLLFLLPALDAVLEERTGEARVQPALDMLGLGLQICPDLLSDLIMACMRRQMQVCDACACGCVCVRALVGALTKARTIGNPNGGCSLDNTSG